MTRLTEWESLDARTLMLAELLHNRVATYRDDGAWSRRNAEDLLRRLDDGADPTRLATECIDDNIHDAVLVEVRQRARKALALELVRARADRKESSR